MLVLARVCCQFVADVQPGCDLDAAKQCEMDLLECRLFSGPADDPPTMCRCGEQFYGVCLRLAGCEMHEELNPPGELYMKKCVDHIYRYDCNPPDPLMCAINCASPGTVDAGNSRLMLFNNYGGYHLRLRICENIVHPLRLKTYSVVDPVPCNNDNENTEDDFLICGRWIPPQTFTPVALPPGTTYIEIDKCIVNDDGSQLCIQGDEPVRVYGNSQLFPETYNAPKSAVSECSSDDDCLGSFCERKLRPAACAPKLRRNIEQSGANYFEVD